MRRGRGESIGQPVYGGAEEDDEHNEFRTEEGSLAEDTRSRD